MMDMVALEALPVFVLQMIFAMLNRTSLNKM
jgi:hypothetical protein